MIFRLVAVVAALHMVVLSLIFGLRHAGYMLAATLSATLIWGVLFFWNERKRRAGFIAGVLVGLAVQQAAHQAWKAELPDLWWPLAQFAAVQVIFAYGLQRRVP